MVTMAATRKACKSCLKGSLGNFDFPDPRHDGLEVLPRIYRMLHLLEMQRT